MIVKQLFDEDSSTYTYLLADPSSRQAVIIDTVAEKLERDLQVIGELGLELVYILDTHVHADHVTGSGPLREKTGAKTVVSAAADVACADVAAQPGQQLAFGSYSVEVRSTPGHTDGCVTFVVRDQEQTYAFTGDAVLTGGCGRTDFQQGNARTLYRSVHEQIFTLPDDTILFPAHDYHGRTSSTVGQERAQNMRLNSEVSEDEFVEIMARLDLPRPKRMDEAVPANLACGRTEDPTRPQVRNIDPSQLDERMGYRIIDVRQPEEFNDELGHIEGAALVPLPTLAKEAAQWSHDDKLLLVCRSGGRSGQACEYLAGQGFRDVTNLAGGMLAWQRRGQRSA